MDFLNIFIEEATEILSMWEETLLEYDHSDPKHTVGSLFRYAHSIKGSSKSVGLDEIGSFVHRVEDYLKILQEHPETFSQNDIDFLMLVHSVLSEAMNHSNYKIEDSSDTESIKDFLNEKMGTSIKQENSSSSFGFFDEEASPKNNGFGFFEDSKKDTLPPQSNKQSIETVKIRLDKINQLTRIYGELKISIEGLDRSCEDSNISIESFIKRIKNLRRIQLEIEQPILSLNLESIKPVLLKLKKVGTDVARKLNKEIKFITFGEDVELDKKIHNKIKEPLEHIIRNAVDHGIETADIRKETGKDPIATIEIGAQNHGNSVQIIIKDDGGGINKKKVLKKAVENKIIQEENIASMSDLEINKLIITPGFSTAETVTDVSGRGVGMDIVHTNVKQLDGEIEIFSEEQIGTEFSITIPSNFSIQDVFIIEGKYHNICVLTNQVDHMIQLQRRTDEEEDQLHNFQEKLYSPIYLTDVMNNSNLFEEPQFHGLFISGISSKYLVVPKITRRQSIVFKSLETRVSSSELYRGATILNNGEPSLIIDAQALLNQSTAQEQAA